jgi:lipid II:glycine glycyltransferase (peptidoglycan interpeptide bridge formation enzyme)
MGNNIQFRKPLNNEEWDRLVLTLPNYSFLNSSARYEYLEKIKSNSFRYLVYEDDNFRGIIAGNIGNSRIFGKFLECKHSPLLNNDSEDLWEEVLSFCKKLASDNSCFMVRLSPLYLNNNILKKVYEENRGIKAPTHNIDALISQYFDMSKSEEELRHDMTDSTRNNINKLMKNPNISVKVFNDDSQFDIFRDFHEQTRKKKGYADKPAKLLLEELQVQVDHHMCYMIVGYFKDKPISVWQCTVFGKYMHIYQAGSDTEFREKNIRITYLLFWESVKLAKELQCEVLDLFGGMVPDNYKGRNHPWIGVDSFKESLGGKKITYMHTRDIPIEVVKYAFYYIYSYIRTTLKGYTIKW